MNITNTSSSISTHDFRLNGEWEVYGTSSEWAITVLDCCPGTQTHWCFLSHLATIRGKVVTLQCWSVCLSIHLSIDPLYPLKIWFLASLNNFCFTLFFSPFLDASCHFDYFSKCAKKFPPPKQRLLFQAHQSHCWFCTELTTWVKQGLARCILVCLPWRHFCKTRFSWNTKFQRKAPFRREWITAGFSFLPQYERVRNSIRFDSSCETKCA